SSRRRHTSFSRDWSSDVCSSDLTRGGHAMIASVRAELLRLSKWPATWIILGTWFALSLAFGYLFDYLVYRREVEGPRAEASGREIGRASCRERVEIAVAAEA